MSRIGKSPIALPNGVEVTLNLPEVTVKGPKGTLATTLNSAVSVSQEELDGVQSLVVDVADKEGKDRAQWGTARAVLANLVEGVTEGFTKSLEVVGVGYRVNLQGKTLVLGVGYSHDVNYDLPEGVDAEVEKNTITLKSANKQLLGQVASEIRKVRKPEPYKGKGIRYSDEVVRRKVGKAAKAGE